MRVNIFRRFSTKSRLPFKLDVDKIVNIKYDSFLNLDNSYMTDKSWTNEIIDRVMKHNSSKSIKNLFSKNNWSLSIFNIKNEPIIIDTIENTTKFVNRYNDKFLWTLDMPIKMPNKPWMIPKELEQFIEFIQKAERYERLINPSIDDCYAYLCVDQRDIHPGQSQRRPGWHSDSFVTKNTSLMARSVTDFKMDSIYLTYDTLPTEFCPGPFPFSSNIDANDNNQVLAHFEKESINKPILTYAPFNIIKMGPECVHRVGFNNTNEIIKRTFAKLVFSYDIFNRDGNDHNSLYDYNWLMIPRGLERNNSSIIGSSINGVDISEYTMLTKSYLLNKFSDIDAIYYKINSVKAEPAHIGELLQTELDGFVTSYCIAKKGDWKITTSLGDQYFLSSEKMDKYYDYDDKSHMFKSNNFRVKAFELNINVQIMSPWGYPQYLKAGDYIVMRDIDDIYGVMKKSFHNNYRSISKN